MKALLRSCTEPQSVCFSWMRWAFAVTDSLASSEQNVFGTQSQGVTSRGFGVPVELVQSCASFRVQSMKVKPTQNT